MAYGFFHGMARGEEGAAYEAARTALRPLSALFGLGVGLRNRLYDRSVLPVRRLPVPVISVGNLTAGGTGKTPAVAFLARLLLSGGRRPGVLSRGYGARADGALSDENLLLREALPEVPLRQDPDRFRAGRALLDEEGADCLLLDDGFQHRRLHRDLDLLLVDATAPRGGGRLLPAGLLREPLASASRASLVVLTRSGQVDAAAREALKAEVRSWGYEGEVLASSMRPRTLFGPGGRELSWLRDRSVFLFSGVGNPASFRRTAESLGVQVAGEERFADHHAYTREDAARLSLRAGRAGAACLLTTVKDWVKIRAWMPDAPPPFLALDIAMHIEEGEGVLRQRLEGLFLADASLPAGGGGRP